MPDALVERDGALMIVTMNRPHRKNAQSGAMLVRMLDAWMEASADDVVYTDGRVHVKGSPETAKTIQEIAGAAALA